VTYIADMNLPSEIAVMTLPDATLFPQAFLPLHIFESRYRRMLDDSLGSHRMFSVAMQRPGRKRETPSPVAGLGLIRASVGRSDGTSNLVLQGIARVALAGVVRYRPYRVHRIQPLHSQVRDSVVVDALTLKLLELVTRRLQEGSAVSLVEEGQLKLTCTSGPTPESATGRSVEILAELKNPEQIVDLVSWTLLTDAEQRQTLLETLDLEERLRRLIRFLLEEPGVGQKN
jgi:ATP-dependent Lon protease